MANTDCSASGIYSSLSHCKGKTVLPGLRPVVYFAPKSHIVSFPSLPDLEGEDVTMKTVAVLDGSYTMAADKKFNRLDILTPASNLKADPQGTIPSKTFLVSATLKYAGNNEEAAGFARMANSDDLVYVIQQRDGKFRVIGNEAFETETNVSQDSGMAVTDASGTTLEVSTTEECPAPFYTGTLPTVDGNLNCSTGKITAD